MSKIEKLVFSMAEPIAKEIDKRIYDIEFKKEGPDWFLRVFLFDENSISIDDCEYVSRKLSDKLDEEDPIAEPYCLEVSSPGIERILKEDWHFETAIGENVEVKLYAPIDGAKTMEGELEAYKNGVLTLKKDDGSILIDKKQVAQVKTVF